MTTLQEACEKVLEAWQTSCYGKVSHQKAMGMAMTDLRAALAQQGNPAGWMLVPVVPTPQMIDAGQDVEDLYRRGTPDTWGKVYRAMLAAAPAPQPVGINGLTEAETSASMSVFGLSLPAPQPAQLKKRDIGEYSPEWMASTYFRGLGWNEAIDAMQSAQPVAPLTDAWIRERTKQPWIFDTVKQWVREIEAAHGIKEVK